MAEELQHLMERIQTEAVDQADEKAKQIVSQAKQQAAATVREAEEKAKQIVKQAEQDARVYMERSEKTLEQSARDLLITVGQGVENVLADLVGEAVDEALRPEVLEQMLVHIVEAYAAGGEERIEVLVGEPDRERIIQFFKERYREKMEQGLEVRADHEVLKGFRVGLSGGRVYLDFTDAAIAEALTHFLRPHLAEIVSRVARGETNGNGGGETAEAAAQ